MSPTIRAGASGTNQTPTIVTTKEGGWVTTRDTAWAVTNHVGSGVDENFARAGHLVYKNIANCLSTSNQRIDYETETFVLQYDGYNQKLETDGIHRTLRTGKDSGDFVAEPVPASVARMRGGKPGGGKGPLIKEEMSLTLATSNDQTLFEPENATYRVRRLTPRECERLQGWPDDHTRWADTGKELADSARYKMCGNGISAPVAQWLGENLIGGQQ